MITKKGFTLVELIIVITILAILGSIAFVSYSGYIKSANNSKKQTELVNFENKINIYFTQNSKYPHPDNSSEITDGSDTIIYQGYAGNIVLGALGIGKMLDVTTGNSYIYSTTSNYKKYQLISYENNITYKNNINIALAEVNDYSLLSYKTIGNNGLILTDVNSKPINIDNSTYNILDTNNNYNLIVSDSEEINATDVTTKNQALAIITRKNIQNCEGVSGANKKTYFLASDGTGYYGICDNEYSLLMSVTASGTTWTSLSEQWTNPVFSEENDILNFESNNDLEITTKAYELLNTNFIKICRGDSNHCYEMNHKFNIPLEMFYTQGKTYVDYENCTDKSNTSYCSWDNDLESKKIDRLDEYFTNLGFNKISRKEVKNGIGININKFNKIGYQGDSNNNRPSFDNSGLGIGTSRLRNCLYINKELYPNGGGYDYTRMRSVGLNSNCAYITPDTKTWYIYGK